MEIWPKLLETAENKEGKENAEQIGNRNEPGRPKPVVGQALENTIRNQEEPQRGNRDNIKDRSNKNGLSCIQKSPEESATSSGGRLFCTVNPISFATHRITLVKNIFNLL